MIDNKDSQLVAERLTDSDEDLRVIAAGRDGQALAFAAAALRSSRVAQSLAEVAVWQARLQGATWQQVADVLGVTRQGAQQKYGS